MTLSGLVTFWALMITAYSVLPEYWKFKLKAFVELKWTVLAFVVSSALVSGSMLMSESGWIIAINGWILTIIPTYLQITAYTVLFLYVLLIAYQLQQSRVSPLYQTSLFSLATRKG